jgi:hypothetical protein
LQRELDEDVFGRAYGIAFPADPASQPAMADAVPAR